MKKIISGLLIAAALTLSTTSCGQEASKNSCGFSATDRFEVIDSGSAGIYSPTSLMQFLIDKNTGIVWVYVGGADLGGISPYYIIGEDGCSHMVKLEDGKMVEIPNP
jgi:hypothetical protein